mgnify:CR=1 FL=1
MQVNVEFSGVSRVLTRTRKLSVDLKADATFRDLLHELGRRYPELMGEVINPTNYRLEGANMLNLNGERMLQPDQMDASPQDGDRIILMSVLAGG